MTPIGTTAPDRSGSDHAVGVLCLLSPSGDARGTGRAVRHGGPALDQAVPVRQQHRPPRPAPDGQPESLHRSSGRGARATSAIASMSSPTRQRYPLDEVLARFQQAVDMVVRTLEAQDADTLVPSGRGPASDPDATGTVFGVCCPHE